MKTVEELEALLETVTRERDLSLSAWEAAGMTGRTAQSAMLELARHLEEARAEVERLMHQLADQTNETTRVRLEAKREGEDAYRRGAEAMREACANAMHPIMRSMISRTEAAQTIRALPIPEEP